MMDYKFTENPFSSRKPPVQNINRTISQRSRWMGPVAYTVALIAFGMVVTALTSSLPNTPVATIPSSSKTDRQPFRPAGLRGQASLVLLHANDESPPKPSVIAEDTPPSDILEEDIETDMEEDEATSDHDPEYIMPLRKFLGTRQQAAQREHHEIHDQVQDHIFGQNRSGSSVVEIEDDPSVIVKDWESDAEDEEEDESASKKTAKIEINEEEHDSTPTEEDELSEEIH